MTTVDPSMHSGSSQSAARDRAMLAHDLRGALQGVSGGVAMLDATALPSDARDQIDRIATAAGMLGRLVNSLLIAEPQPGAQHVVDIARFSRHMTRRWAGEARQRGLRFCVEAEPGVAGSLRVDLTLLLRAVGNLIGNAVEHGRGGDVRLVVGATADGGVAFEVNDDGPGVPQDVVERAMRPALRPTGLTSDGHGLGLNIARSLCVEMGGTFSLANRSSGGAAAALVFPPALCGPAPDRPADAPPGGRLDLGGLRVLLAEDNPTNQMVATQMLHALNARVTLTSDGIEALDRFEADEFDMVVVDIEMPRMSGLDVIRAIRSRPDARAGVPIVALTAYVMREHRDRIAAAGADGLIAKPITSVDALGRTLRAHVDAARRAAPPDPAQPGPDAAGEPVADLAVFDALCAAIGAPMMAELLEKVVADLLQARADLAGALDPIDPRPIRSASHILISVAGAVGANRLQARARTLNVAAHGGDPRDLAGDVRGCLDEIDAAVAFAQSRRDAS